MGKELGIPIKQAGDTLVKVLCGVFQKQRTVKKKQFSLSEVKNVFPSSTCCSISKT